MSESPTVTSTTELVLEAQKGSQAAFEQLVESHYGLVFSIAYGRLCDSEAAEDLVQDVFLRAWLQIATLRKPESFPFWVSRMARHLAISWQRSNRRKSELLPIVSAKANEMENVKDSSPAANDLVMSKELQEKLKGAVQSLPPQEREATLMHFMEGMPKNEVARHMGIHPATVGRTLDRAYTQLRDFLGEEPRESLASFDNLKSGPAAAMSSVAVVAAMSPGAREALVLAASKGLPAIVSAHTSTSSGTLTVSFISLLWQSIFSTIQGVFMMGTAKTVSIATVGIALAAVGGWAVTNHGRSKPELLSSSITANSNIASASTSVWPAKNVYAINGFRWKINQKTEVEINGNWIDYINITHHCRVLAVDDHNNSLIELTVKSFNLSDAIPDKDNIIKSLVDKTFELKMFSDGKVVLLNTRDAAIVPPSNLVHLLSTLGGVDLGPLTISQQMGLGESYGGKFSVVAPDVMSGSIDGQYNYDLESIEDQNGKTVAVFALEHGSTFGGGMPLHVDERTRTVVRLDSQNTNGSGKWMFEMGDKIRAEQTLSGITSDQSLSLVISVPGRDEPVVQPIDGQPDQPFRVITTYEEL